MHPASSSPADRTTAVTALSGDGGPHLVTATGTLDLGTSDQLKGALQRAVAQPPNSVVVDFTRVSFIDSTAISLLMNARRRLIRSGRGFAMAVGDGPVRRVLDLALLGDTLAVSDSVPDATRRAQAEANRRAAPG